jgi:predicted SprT family Zn-dependent metalloprotease
MDLFEAELMATNLIAEHKPDYKFGWIRAVRILGKCSFRRKTIFLSKAYVKLNSEDSVRDTILHELAHAKVGAGIGHSRPWREMSILMGANPSAYSKEGLNSVERPYIGICKKCGLTFERHRLPRKRKLHHISCGSIDGAIEWKRK